MSATGKLSKLQRAILTLALSNKLRENRSFDCDDGCDAFYSELLMKIYGFPMRKDYGGLTPRQLPCSRIFSPAAIGRCRYRSAQASLSRAVFRLHIRGLVKSVHARHSAWSGLNLTRAGERFARTLETGKAALI